MAVRRRITPKALVSYTSPIESRFQKNTLKPSSLEVLNTKGTLTYHKTYHKFKTKSGSKHGTTRLLLTSTILSRDFCVTLQGILKLGRHMQDEGKERGQGSQWVESKHEKQKKQLLYRASDIMVPAKSQRNLHQSVVLKLLIYIYIPVYVYNKYIYILVDPPAAPIFG